MPKPQPYRAEDGTVTYRVRLRVDGRQTSETFPNIAAANSFCTLIGDIGASAASAQRAMTDPASPDYVPTVAQMLTKHVADLTGVDKRTRDDYHSLARRHWTDLIGHYRVTMVTRTLAAHVVNQLDGKVAPKTIKNAYSLLSSVMQTAVYEGHVDANPCKGIRLPRTGEETAEEIRYLTYAEFDRLLASIPAHYLPFVVLLFGTGLRFSEATALQVQDIDIENATLRVMRAWKREKGQPIRLGPPKSKASRRTIALPVEVADAVKPLLDRPGSAWLFTTVTDRIVLHSNFYNRVWKPACIAASHDPRPRIHDARHTHASWLIAQGARLEVVQDRLGHEDYTTTRKVYGHLMPDMRREAGLTASMAFASTSLGTPAIEGS